MKELRCPYFDVNVIRSFLLDDDGANLCDDDSISPVCLTFPMGLAHSPCVAQVMTASYMAAGFKAEQFLTKAGSLPSRDRTFIAVATDDINSFTRLFQLQRSSVCSPPLRDLDQIWASWGIQPQLEKSVDLAKSETL